MSSKSSSDRSPGRMENHLLFLSLGMGILKNCSSAFSRNSSIHSGSPLIREISSTTSRDSPFLERYTDTSLSRNPYWYSESSGSSFAMQIPPFLRKNGQDGKARRRADSGVAPLPQWSCLTPFSRAFQASVAHLM